MVFARRLVAQRCLYGVDRNPVAVDLAKMSLWLVTLAKDHALTFVDHALRHGDSLVGLSRRQLEAFHWAADAPRFQAGFEAVRAREHLARVSDLRRKIREADESISDAERRDLWDKAQRELSQVRLLGDLAIAAFFEAEKPKEREAKRAEFAKAVVNGDADRYRGWLEERRHADPPLAPFHWEIEFPEVFERENPGFDAFVGNPPFAGQERRSSAELGQATSDWLQELHEGATATPIWSLTSSAAPSTTARERRLRPDRHEHDRPGRHACERPALDLPARWRRSTRVRRRVKWPGHGGGGGERGPCDEGQRSRARSARRPRGRDDHRVSVPPRRPRRSRRLAANAGKSFQGSTSRHGLHFR